MNELKLKNHIGEAVMSLADQDNVPAKAMLQNFEISSPLTRLYKYEGRGVEAIFRIFIDAKVNDKDISYAVVNTRCGLITLGRSDGKLRNIYETINKDKDGDFSNIVKLIKPGNFLWHNLVNSQIQDKKCNVDIYFNAQTAHIKGKIVGHTKKSRKIGKHSSVPFILFINNEKGVHEIPINIIDFIFFKNKPRFEDSQKGIITHLTTELLSSGHICRGEPLAGYVIDACYSKKRLIYFDLNKFEFFTIPPLNNENEHDNDIKDTIQKIKNNVNIATKIENCNMELSGGENNEKRV